MEKECLAKPRRSSPDLGRCRGAHVGVPEGVRKYNSHAQQDEQHARGLQGHGGFGRLEVAAYHEVLEEKLVNFTHRIGASVVVPALRLSSAHRGGVAGLTSVTRQGCARKTPPLQFGVRQLGQLFVDGCC